MFCCGFAFTMRSKKKKNNERSWNKTIRIMDCVDLVTDDKSLDKISNNTKVEYVILWKLNTEN